MVKVWYLPIHDITDQLGFLVELLPVVHLITGCDSVSSLFGIGKKNAFEILKQIQRVSLTWDYLVIPRLCQLLIIMWKPASNSFVPDMTSHTQNITLVICDTNYSLKKSFPWKATINTRLLIIPTSASKLSMLCLEKGLYSNFGTTRSCSEWMGEERRNTGARKKSSKFCTRNYCWVSSLQKQQGGVKQMPVVVKRQDLRVQMRVYVTRQKNAKTKMIIIVMTVVKLRCSNCNTWE